MVSASNQNKVSLQSFYIESNKAYVPIVDLLMHITKVVSAKWKHFSTRKKVSFYL